MGQIIYLRLQMQKARYGWYCNLVDVMSKTRKRFWRPSKTWAYKAAARWHHWYVWGD